MSILIFILITILFLIINSKISKKSLFFLRTLSVIDGIAYFLYMFFCFGCFLIVFQEIKIPILCEHPIWFKLLLCFTSFKLTSLKLNIQSITQPNNKTRLDLVENLNKQDEILKEIEEKERKFNEIKIKQKQILKDFKSELFELENGEYSEEELQEKIKNLTDKYDKLFNECRKEIK